MQESQNIEYKEIWKDEYLKWIAGFANASGGKLYLGINDSGIIVGIKNIKKLLEDIPNKIVSALGIITEIKIQKKDNLNYLEIAISPSSVPISYKGAYYLRSGSTIQELKATALHSFLLKRLGKTWDDLPCDAATLEDIDISAVEYFFKKAIKSNRVSKDANAKELTTILINLNLLTEGKLKNAAVLLFGKQPTRFFPGAIFKIGRFVSGDDDLRFQDIIEGNIIEMADKVLEILKNKYLVSFIHYEGLQRIEKFELPVEALREAIFNAIVHKDYTGAPIQLSVYQNRLLLWNEGRLPDGFTVKTLLEKHPSRPYNKTIADIFFKSGFIEAWGRGISKILNGFKEAGLPLPDFASTMGGILVTIIRKDNVLSEELNNGRNTEEIRKKYGRNTEEILKIIVKNPECTTQIMAEQMNVSISTIEKNIAKLKKEGIIERVGSTKRGYWKIKTRNPKRKTRHRR
ncbi:MAG: ATP-binding protein [Bacteroidales bacterium]|nr:ATP-binding protein [Bacteroidales bacterium]